MRDLERELEKLQGHVGALTALLFNAHFEISELALREYLLRQSMTEAGVPTEALDEAFRTILAEHQQATRDRLRAVLAQAGESDSLLAVLESIRLPE